MDFQQHFPIASGQPVLRGHFPGRPILPGVMLLNFVKLTLADGLGEACRIKRIIRHKFVRPVLPGFEIRVRCSVQAESLQSPFLVDCRIFDQNGAVVANGSYTVELVTP